MRSGLIYLVAGLLIGVLLMGVLGATSGGRYAVVAGDSQVVMYEPDSGSAWLLNAARSAPKWARITGR